jgi:hypothetical protein
MRKGDRVDKTRILAQQEPSEWSMKTRLKLLHRETWNSELNQESAQYTTCIVLPGDDMWIAWELCRATETLPLRRFGYGAQRGNTLAHLRETGM